MLPVAHEGDEKRMNACPQCDSKAFKKNGFTRHGKQNHRCLDCGRQFSRELEIETISKAGETQLFAIHESKVIEITVPRNGA